VAFYKRGEGTGTYYRELITQFHTLDKYQSNETNGDETKNRILISDYRIESSIASNLTFSASSTIRFRSRTDSLRWIPFYLYSRLTVGDVLWNGEVPAAYFRHRDGSMFWVRAPRPLHSDELCSLMVTYRGDLLERNEDGWIGLKSSSSWYPRYGYRTRANFDLTFRSPATFKLVSAGKRLYEQQSGDTVTSRWVTVRPSHNVSFTVGKFREIMPDEDGAHAEKSEGEDLPDVHAYAFEYAPRRFGSNLATEVRSDMLNSMRFFQHVYGKSPVDEVHATETPYFHGEAFPGLIHLSWATYKRFDKDGGNEIFRAHEVAHQWWGVGVNFKTYHDQWLSEAFSEYSGLWYMQAVLNDNKKFFNALEKMKERILGNRKFLLGSGQEAGPVWLGYRTQSSNTRGDYDLIVYKKGAWILHMLRNMLLDLRTMNEEKFKNMMREFYSTYLGKEASTRDFQRTVEKHIGSNMTWFFNQWVMDTKVPEYTFSYKTEEVPDGKFRVTVRVLQENVPKDFSMPVPLLIKFPGDKFIRIRIVVSGEKAEQDLPLLPLKPTDIIFNDLSSVLCEVNYKRWK
ncbi:MAG: hypothetical protein KF749_17680, partial [Bacteroidetes bacterium]|nr:hypothetical protein [Bacteroidota bacterium]